MNKLVSTYIRVSTDHQETNTQDQQCFRYCEFKKANNPEFESPETYEDTDVSGSVAFANRPGAGRLLQAVQREEISHIVVAKLDRLGRSAEDILRIVRICEQHGTVIHFTDLGGDIITTGGSAGKMVVTMMAAFAEFERNRIKERILDRMETKRSQSTVPGSWGEVCGTIPYGWRAVKTKRINARGKTVQELIPHEQEQQTLNRLIIQRYGTEATVEQNSIIPSITHRPPSFAKLADWLNNNGIPNKSGGKWSQGSVAHVLNNTYTRQLIERIVTKPNSKRTNPNQD